MSLDREINPFRGTTRKTENSQTIKPEDTMECTWVIDESTRPIYIDGKKLIEQLQEATSWEECDKILAKMVE